MKLTIKHQETNSRGQLLLRTFFGGIYIGIPHFFLLFFVMIGAYFCVFISWWSILFTGKYPKGMHNYLRGTVEWYLRVMARFPLNLCDGYPKFGINAKDECVSLEFPCPEKFSRGTLLLKLFFGGLYVMIPHMFILYFLGIGVGVVNFIAWWVILFTGKYPEGMHRFVVGYIRWMVRVMFYYPLYMTDQYPPFSGKPDEELNTAAAA
jgi:hypothetical protein